jgi:SAM-dependent methyltransferase
VRPSIKVALPIAAVAAAALALALHRRSGSLGQPVAGGVLIGDAAAYDRLTGWLLGSFHDGIAADIAATMPSGASVLDVGCGPGHLTRRLAALGFDATGIDLDPAMIERATARGGGHYAAADVASLPFDDGVFDLVVSTLSMHHWTDTHAGLAEIGRVVRPEGRVLIWDLGRGAPLHAHAPDPMEAMHGAPLDVVGARPWRWPGPLTFVQRIELRPGVASAG